MKSLIIVFSLISLIIAVPAYKGEIEFKQKDGSVFKGHLKGDEYFSWIEDKQGNIIKYNNKSKAYEYAVFKQVNGKLDLVPSGTKVSKHLSGQKASFSPSLKSSKKQLADIWSRKKSEIKYHH